MLKIKALIFDIDNTLYSYDAAHRAAFHALSDYACRTFGLSEDAFAGLHRRGDQLLRTHTGQLCSAIHNRLIRYQLMLEELGRPISYAPEMAQLYWSAFLEAVKPDPAAAECLSGLREAGYTVGIGTNMTADYQFAKLERMDLLRHVDFMVTSEEAGAEKPDGRLFALCAKKAGCPAERCVFVGDSLEGDALGAQAAGMIPVWLAPGEARPAAPDGVYALPALARLPELLRTISLQE